MKDKSTWFLGLAVLGFAAWYFIDTHQAQTRENRTAEIRQQQRNKTIAALAVKYNANTNWQSALPNQGLGLQLSIDVSRALTANNQVVLFVCILDDIVEQDGKTVAKLIPLEASVIDMLALQCSPAQAKLFTRAKESSAFVVVARCHDVQRKNDNDGSFLINGELFDAVQLP
jgi:hypothetical protein